MNQLILSYIFQVYQIYQHIKHKETNQILPSYMFKNICMPKKKKNPCTTAPVLPLSNQSGILAFRQPSSLSVN